MNKPLSDYDQRVIADGDVTSAQLNEYFAPTREARDFVRTFTDGMNGVTAMSFSPKQRFAVAFQAGGSPRETDLGAYGRSVIDNLVNRARQFGVTPRGFSSVIDSRSEKFDDILPAIAAMRERCLEEKIAVTNGEFAVHGERVRDLTIGGFLVCEDARGLHTVPGPGVHGGISYVVFPHENGLVYVNNDGNGTKGLLQLMRGNVGGAVQDAAAMLADDTAKIGAQLKALLFIADYRGAVDLAHLYAAASGVHRHTQAIVSLLPENVGSRLTAYAPGFPALNVGGAAISVTTEEKLRSLPTPQAGDTLLYVKGNRPNPRSNGITADREALELLGAHWAQAHGTRFWHETPEGKDVLAFFAEPSEILYPAFNKLLLTGAASGVYHPSGGGYLGKLARPLAKQGLFVRITDLPEPDRRQLRVGETLGFTLAQMYNKWNMGVDGFVATSDVEHAQLVLGQFGLTGTPAGRIEKLPDLVGVYLDTKPSGKISYAAANTAALDAKQFRENIS